MQDIPIDDLPMEIIKSEDANLMGGLTEARVKKAEESIDFVKRIRIAALRMTSKEDWRDFGGDKPYLEDSGATKIGLLCGVSFTDTDVVSKEFITDPENGEKVFVVTAKSTGHYGLRQEEEFGISTSKDAFVGLRYGKWLSLAEISIPNLIKKAVTSAKGRAAKKLLALNFSWDDLASIGIPRKDVSKAYKDKGGGGGQSPGAAPSSPPSTENDDEIRQKLRSMCLDFCNGDAKAAGAFLKEQSTFTGRDGNVVEGKARVDWLKGKWLQSTYGKVKKMYEELQQKPPPPEDDPFSHPSEPGENG